MIQVVYILSVVSEEMRVIFNSTTCRMKVCEKISKHAASHLVTVRLRSLAAAAAEVTYGAEETATPRRQWRSLRSRMAA